MPRKVSIIVISYNALDNLKECLESLESLDYNEKEIIVVNDASTDGTSAFLARYRSRTNTRIKVINNEKNLGVAGARNAGIQHASGEIMAFTDSDCVADMSWISELIQGYGHKDVAAVGGSISDKRITNIWELVRKGHDFIAHSEGYVPFIKGCNMSFDSKVLKKYMFDDEIKYGYEELLLCNNLIDDGYKIFYRPQARVHHKHRSNLRALLKQIYLRGMSSIWYLKKRNKFFMYKRHFLLFCALLFIPFYIMHNLLLYLSFFLFFVSSFYLLLEEITFNRKSVKEILVTFPFIIFIEFFHFAGAIAGLIKFRVFKRIELK
ncbi:glycosyltransferase family 2 protein [Thermodesulfobacteriota bacterium]